MKNRVAIVTGAANGIGAATAERLANSGFQEIHLIDLDAIGLARVAERLKSLDATAILHPGGVQDEMTWAGVASAVGDEVHALVNNAYRIHRAPLTEQSSAGWDEQLAVNLKGPFLALRALAPQLTKAHGAVVNVASVHAHVGIPGHSAYAASKGAILALTRETAVELAPHIRVNTVVPGPILTAAWDDIPEAERERSADATALLRLGTPQEVAAAIAFLVSDDASYITGTSLVVDGGWLVKKTSA